MSEAILYLVAKSGLNNHYKQFVWGYWKQTDSSWWDILLVFLQKEKLLLEHNPNISLQNV